MINLLPPDVKTSITYARRNTRLRQWTIAVLFAVIAILGVVGAGYIYLQSSIHSYAAQVEQGKQELQNQKLDETQAKIQDITTSLKLVIQVLSREILFSKLIPQIGAALPNGSVLTNLSINKTQGGLDLSLAAVDYQTATQAQINLKDPKNKIFDTADIVSIQCRQPQAQTDPFLVKYPCAIQLRALYVKSNPFALIAPQTSGVKP